MSDLGPCAAPGCETLVAVDGPTHRVDGQAACSTDCALALLDEAIPGEPDDPRRART